MAFKTEKPVALDESAVSARLSRIAFDKPMDEVQDWDDRLRVVRWVDAVPPSLAKPTSASSSRCSHAPSPRPTYIL